MLKEKLLEWVKKQLEQLKESIVLAAKSFLWFFMTLLFGVVLQLIAIYTINHFHTPIDKSFDIEFLHQKIIMEGLLVFFSMTVISSLIIDHYYFIRMNFTSVFFTDFVFKLIFSFFPIFIFFFCALILSACYIPNMGKNFENIAMAQLLVLFITAFYAMIIKMNYFRNK